MGLFLIFEIFILMMIFYLVSLIWRGRASQHWPSTKGRIDTSRVDARRVYGKGGSYTVHDPMIMYRYKVGKSEYFGARVSFDLGSDTSASAHRIVDQYPYDSPVEVFYNPKDPSKAVLDRSNPKFGYYMWLLFFSAVSVIIALAYARY
jgi:hypothetical protein